MYCAYQRFSRLSLCLGFLLSNVSIVPGDYDEAIRMCQSPDISVIPLVQSLMAYTMSRAKRRPEAMQLCRRLMKNMPTDNPTIETLVNALRNCRAEHDVAICYETLVQKNPQDPGLILSCFCLDSPAFAMTFPLNFTHRKADGLVFQLRSLARAQENAADCPKAFQNHQPSDVYLLVCCEVSRSDCV